MSEQKQAVDLAALQQLRDSMPFAVLLGIELIEATPELVKASLAYNPDNTTVDGIVHGGALIALADTCGAVCAVLNLPHGATGTATIESKTNLLRATRQGTLTATTRPLHAGRTSAVLETEIVQDDGRLAAKTTQIQAYHYPPGQTKA